MNLINKMNWVRDWEYIPKQAFLFFPKGQDIKSGQGSNYIRRIFENGQPYQPFEQKKLRQLEQNLKKKKTTVISWFTQANKLRALLGKKFDIDDTRKSIEQHCRWRSQTFPISMTPKLTTFINSGAIYFCGRDHQFRPIIVFDITKIDMNDSEIQKIEFLSKVFAVYFEFMFEELMVEGQVENYVMLINLNKMGIWDIGGIMKRIIGFTTNTYRSRLFVSYVVNSPGGINILWSTAKAFVSENTAKKVRTVDTNVAEELFTHCNRDQVQVKFGGTKPNITSGFWKPQGMAVKGVKGPQVRLATEDEYREIWGKGKLENRKVCKQIVEKTKAANVPVPLSTIRQESNTAGRTSNTPKQVHKQQISIQPQSGAFPDIMSNISAKNTFLNSPHPASIHESGSSSFSTSNKPLPINSSINSKSGRDANEIQQGPNLLTKSHDNGFKINQEQRVNTEEDWFKKDKGMLNSQSWDISIKYEPELRINQIKSIKPFFLFAKYKQMKKTYYEFI